MLPVQGDGEVAFYGGSFTLLSERLQIEYLRPAQDFVRRGRAGGIRISTRPDALGDGTLRLLRDAGVTTIEVGCQSFCATVLRACGRGHNPATACDAIGRARRYGFNVGVQLMPGLPGGDAGEGRRSLQCALALQPDFLRIYPAVVLRGTPMEAMWRSGAYRPFALEEAIEICADMLLTCRAASMPIIRLGLQGTPHLEETFLAGPWHPAFGQLVRSRLWRRALALLGRSGAAKKGIEIHPADLAEAIGHRRENVLWFQERFGDLHLFPGAGISRSEIRCEQERFSLDDLCRRLDSGNLNPSRLAPPTDVGKMAVHLV